VSEPASRDWLGSARSFLFVPGDRPERFGKAAASGADVVVLDLEDAVTEENKPAALRAILTWLDAGHRGVVRVNALAMLTGASEIAAVSSRAAAFMLPKVGSAEDVSRAAAHATTAVPILALVETPAGVLAADEIARQPDVARLVLGTVDLAADLRVEHDTTRLFDHARSQLAFASAAAGLPPPVDGITLSTTDHDRLQSDLRQSVTFGHGAKLCIHPGQVNAVNEAFKPSSEQVAWAREVVAALNGRGVATVRGAMVDAPVLARAQRILQLASSLDG